MDYKKLINDINEIKEQQNEASAKQVLEEAMDIIEDYQLQAQDLSELLTKYECSMEPEKNNGYFCPRCEKAVNLRHSRCHHCGQKLSWERRKKQHGTN